jgi:peptidoglycan/xylan/chitin deacetylase (PgdA/CDA1 family)
MKPLKVVFLVGGDSRATVMSIESVCRLRDIRPLAILLDTHKPRLSTRLRNFRGNLGREGFSYAPARLASAINQSLESAVGNIIPRSSARKILAKAFPERCFDLNELSAKFALPVIPIGSLNGSLAARKLEDLDADLGIVIGTRVLRRSTFAVPRLGSVNLHKGAVPEYRGMPPGFWELYNGEVEAGVTVHFVDDTLDTGDIVAESRIGILSLDTPDSLLTKLHLEGAKTLSTAVSAIQSGSFERRVQENRSAGKAYSKPTGRQIKELRQRLPHWNVPSPWASIAKNILVLATYYSGAFSIVKRLHEGSGTRAVVVLYHRVNDVSKDGVTTSLERFAGHMEMIARWYKPIASKPMIEKLRNKNGLPATSIAVHFDDCYRDVYLHAFPIMQAAGVPGTAFINSGYVGTSRVFPHDVKRSPFRFENLTADDLRALTAGGFEIGAHTVNHVDLGTCPMDEARDEIRGSVQQLAAITGDDISLFSFPFGKESNIRSEIRDAVAAAGCSCMFSAFGGVVDASTDLYDVHRFGASDMHSPFHLALEIEGISPNQLMKQCRGALRRL